MSTLLTALNSADMKVRWQEPYVSEALNIALASRKRGVHFGFSPAPGGALVLDLEVDADKGASLLVYRDSTDNLGVTVWRGATVSLDLAAFTGFKIYVGITVSYATGVATTGEIRAYSQAEFNAGLGDVVVLCGVDVPAVTIAASDIDTSVRDRAYKEPSESDRPAVETQRGFVWNALSALSGSNLNGVLEDTAVAPTGDVEYTLEDGSGAMPPPAGENLAYKFTYNGPTAGDVSVWPRNLWPNVVKCQEGDRFEIEFKLLLSAVTADVAGITIVFVDSSLTPVGNWTVGEQSLSGSIAGWTTYRGTITAPASSHWALSFMGVTNLSAGFAGFAALRCSFQPVDEYASGFAVPQSTPTVSIINRVPYGIDDTWVTRWGAGTTLVSTAINVGSPVTWEVGSNTTPVSIELGGQYKYPSTISRVVRKVKTFDGIGAGDIIGGAGTAGTTAFGGFTRGSIDVPGGSPFAGLATVSLGQFPVGATITKVIMGVDLVADANENFGFLIVYDDLTTLQPSAGPGVSVTGLLRSTYGAMGVCTASGLSALINPPVGSFTGDDTVNLFIVLSNGSSTPTNHEFYWVIVEYTIPDVETGLYVFL